MIAAAKAISTFDRALAPSGARTAAWLRRAAEDQIGCPPLPPEHVRGTRKVAEAVEA